MKPIEIKENELKQRVEKMIDTMLKKSEYHRVELYEEDVINKIDYILSIAFYCEDTITPFGTFSNLCFYFNSPTLGSKELMEKIITNYVNKLIYKRDKRLIKYVDKCKLNQHNFTQFDYEFEMAKFQSNNYISNLKI